MVTAPSLTCVLGGRGFIGQHLLEQLHTHKLKTRVLSRTAASTSDAMEGRSFYQGDLLDRNADLFGFLQNCSVIFNCAGELHNEKIMNELHVAATARLLDCCRRISDSTGKPLHWVQLSSVGAYGPPLGGPSSKREVVETTPLHPRGVYEETKTKADELLQNAGAEGFLTYSILRPSIVFGAGMPNDSLRKLVSAIKNRQFLYIGKRDAVSTYIHVDDVVAALLHCGYNPAARNKIFNISNDVSQTSFVESVAFHYSVPPPRLRVPEAVGRLVAGMFSWKSSFPLSQRRIDALVARTTYPCTKLHSELGVVPEKPLTEYFHDALEINVPL